MHSACGPNNHPVSPSCCLLQISHLLQLAPSILSVQYSTTSGLCEGGRIWWWFSCGAEVLGSFFAFSRTPFNQPDRRRCTVNPEPLKGGGLCVPLMLPSS